LARPNAICAPKQHEPAQLESKDIRKPDPATFGMISVSDGFERVASVVISIRDAAVQFAWPGLVFGFEPRPTRIPYGLRPPELSLRQRPIPVQVVPPRAAH